MYTRDKETEPQAYEVQTQIIFFFQNLSEVGTKEKNALSVIIFVLKFIVYNA